MAVALLDAAAQSGTTGTFAVSPGDNRLLVAFFGSAVYGHGGAATITWGTESMTEQIEGNDGNNGTATIWTLDEAGIQAASSTSWVVTGNTASYNRLFIASFQGVDQDTPIHDTHSSVDYNEGPIDVVADGYVIQGAGGRGETSINVTPNASSIVTEQIGYHFNDNWNSVDWIMAYAAVVSSDAAANIEVDWGGTAHGQAQAAISLLPHNPVGGFGTLL